QEPAATIGSRAAVGAERRAGLLDAARRAAALERHATAAAGLRRGTVAAVDRAAATIADEPALRSRRGAGHEAATAAVGASRIAAASRAISPAGGPIRASCVAAGPRAARGVAAASGEEESGKEA